MGSTDFILSAVRFQFRGAKLARIFVLRRTGELGSTDLVLSAVRSSFAGRNWLEFSYCGGLENGVLRI